MNRETEWLFRELLAEKLKHLKRKNEDRDREEFESYLNEALRKKGYPALYPAGRRRGGRG